jgi:hypothetical protein
MRQTKIDFATLLKNYKSDWVGISSDFKSVILSGKTLKDVIRKSQTISEKVYFFQAGQSYNDFWGLSQK